ncbi:MAG: GNAT family N-acetyltransferase [Spirochaetaceae bacterium]|nr:GNAT family N-acetyltransferase [Spirochaetaceae bacterium]MDE0220749.1 GNAT family N-acetyltransferase [Spirochaetaceae bacterium]
MPVLEVRRMRRTELTRVTDLYVRSITTLLRTILTPAQIRTDHEYGSYFADRIANDHELWVAVRGGRPVGVMAMAGEWIEELYIDPVDQRQGVGSALVAHAKALSPNALRVLTLRSNAGACRFYEQHGFVAYDRGRSPPPEDEPDVRYLWRPVRETV